MRESVKYLAALAAASLGFGAGSVVLKMLLRDFPKLLPADLVQVRLMCSGVCLLLLGTFRQKRLPAVRRSDWKRLAILGILGIFVVQFFLMYAVSQIYVGLATFTQSTATLMLCAYSVFAEGERFTRWKGAALLSGFLGLAVILWPSDMSAGYSLLNIGVLAALLSAVGKAFYIIYGKTLQRSYDSMVMIGWAMLLGAIFAWLFSKPQRIFQFYGWDGKLIGLLLVYILFCTVLPFALYFEGLRHSSVSVAGITNIMEPAGGAVMAFFLTGEAMKPIQFLGVLLIVAGVLSAQSEIIIKERRGRL